MMLMVMLVFVLKDGRKGERVHIYDVEGQRRVNGSPVQQHQGQGPRCACIRIELGRLIIKSWHRVAWHDVMLFDVI